MHRYVWEELAGGETLWTFGQGIEFDPDQQIVSYDCRESLEDKSCRLFAFYDRQGKLAVGGWGPSN